MELQAKLTERYEGIALDMEQLNKQVNDLQTELETANKVRERQVSLITGLVSTIIFSMQLLKSKEEEIEELHGKLSSVGEQSRIVAGN